MNHSDRRAHQILARSLARDLEARGFDARDLVAIAAELVGTAADALASRRQRA